jgi:hypothetical protein
VLAEHVTGTYPDLLNPVYSRTYNIRIIRFNIVPDSTLMSPFYSPLIILPVLIFLHSELLIAVVKLFSPSYPGISRYPNI